MIKKKAVTKRKLVKLLDKVFSIYIRIKNADDDGYCTCYTCGTREDWKDMQCGHFVSRSCYVLRWNETNCRVQCYRCNVVLNGNYIEYTMRMISDLGFDFVEKLKMEKFKRSEYSYAQLVDLYNSIVEKLNKLIEQKKVGCEKQKYLIETDDGYFFHE